MNRALLAAVITFSLGPAALVTLALLRCHFRNCGRLILLAVFALGGLMPMARAGTLLVDSVMVEAGEWMLTGPGGGGGAETSVLIDTSTLNIAPTGIQDMKSGAMIVRMDSFPKVEGYVITGYNGGAWNGFGIQSSTAASVPTHLTGVGVINNADAHLTEFQGRSLSTNLEILVSYAYYGDANLDGDVDTADLALMGLGSGWYYGDFNYSGAVDAADYALYQASFDALHPTPEPGVAALLGAGALACFRHRR